MCGDKQICRNQRECLVTGVRDTLWIEAKSVRQATSEANTALQIISELEELGYAEPTGQGHS